MGAKVKKRKETPLMKQFAEIKGKYPGAILLFRVGDFYETFGEDAIKASAILDIVLTKRSNGSASEIELAGFPHHALDTYLPKLVRAGERIAICDQLEDPKATKGIVKRGVTELVTPGLSSSDRTLDAKTNNYLASVFERDKKLGVAFADLSTGEFMVAEGSSEYIERLIKSLQPSEIIISKAYREKFDRSIGSEFYSYALDKWFFEDEFALEQLERHFKVETLKGYGIDEMSLAIIAAGSIIHYLNQTHHTEIEHINTIKRIDEQEYVWVDSFTIRNLELLQSNHHNGKSLLDVIDKTNTPMGSRLLRKWIVLPLREIKQIHQRLDTVDYLHTDSKFKSKIEEKIKAVGDLERIVSKISLKRINPRELLQLSRSLKAIQDIKSLCEEVECRPINQIGAALNACTEVCGLIDTQIHAEAPVNLSKGNVFNDGVSELLDEFTQISRNGKDYLLGIKEKEAERTGISSLKLAFNNVFGYYLEVTHRFKDQVPDDWIRKQTLVNAERYITPELKEFEEKILGAEEKISSIENELYAKLLSELNVYLTFIQTNAQQIASLDCLSSFAVLANKYNYNRPEVDEGLSLAIKDGRHPVIEQQLAIGENYIPNDVYLGNDEQQIIILTGPNMSGKSAILRQTALTVLLAQIGCFVPARHAQIGIVDKIYTRVGASDNISQGESTFMVEMVETASILNNLSERSLIILDEIGRGTSTFDGVSLAWAIAEYLALHSFKPKTLFATHYHELNELENKYEGICNYHLSTEETKSKVIFLRKMKKGGSENSFGIHVAQMAGIPKKVLDRASTILNQLEKDRASISGKEQFKKLAPDNYQLNLFQLNDPKLAEMVELIGKLNIESLTPIEALMKLNELKHLLED